MCRAIPCWLYGLRDIVGREICPLVPLAFYVQGVLNIVWLLDSLRITYALHTQLSGELSRY